MIQMEYRNIDELCELDRNPRTISQKQFDTLKKSLQDNPDYFEARPIILSNRTGKLVIIAGNQRYKAAKALKMDKVPTVLLEGLTEEREHEIIIRDNVANGEWDMDILANEWDIEKLEEWGVDSVGDLDFSDYEEGALYNRFGYPPFSILDTRIAKWQEQVKKWESRGLNSKEGRDEHLIGEGIAVLAKSVHKNTKLNGTSTFDPFLCELMYRWFSPNNGSVLDPFAGGSVRGIVAVETGHEYLGIDLSERQVEANISNADIVCSGIKPHWVNGDSNVELDKINKQFDMIMSCPPYAYLEKYSDNPSDLSNMSYEDFIKTYKSIIKKSCDKLKHNRFAVFVVGEVRDKDDSAGKYLGFVHDTIDAFEESGLDFYNEIILVNCVGTAGLLANRYFNGSRKIVKTHQNVLVFYKKPQNGGKIKDVFKELEFEGIDEE